MVWPDPPSPDVPRNWAALQRRCRCPANIEVTRAALRGTSGDIGGLVECTIDHNRDWGNYEHLWTNRDWCVLSGSLFAMVSDIKHPVQGQQHHAVHPFHADRPSARFADDTPQLGIQPLPSPLRSQQGAGFPNSFCSQSFSQAGRGGRGLVKVDST